MNLLTEQTEILILHVSLVIMKNMYTTPQCKNNQSLIDLIILEFKVYTGKKDFTQEINNQVHADATTLSKTQKIVIHTG